MSIDNEHTKLSVSKLLQRLLEIILGLFKLAFVPACHYPIDFGEEDAKVVPELRFLRSNCLLLLAEVDVLGQLYKEYGHCNSG